MAKPIVLSHQASADRKQILEYWITRNRSNTYSIKLDRIFRENFEILSSYPKLGRLLGIKEIRALVVRDYLFAYQETETNVEIITIWDTRQDPKKLETILETKL